MRLRLLSLALLAGTLSAFACQGTPTVDAAAEEKAIRDHVAEWNNYISAKNDSAIAALYTADAMVYPPNQEPVNGTASIRQFWAVLGTMNASLVLTPTDVEVAPGGTMATEAGTWVFSASTPQGVMTDKGRYLDVWTKVDGEWKVSQDIWNSSNPAPGMPADTTHKM